MRGQLRLPHQIMFAKILFQNILKFLSDLVLKLGPPGGTTFRRQAAVTHCFCCVIGSRIKQRRHVCAREANAGQLNVSGSMERKREYMSPGGRHPTAINIYRIADHFCPTRPLQDALICKRIPTFRIPKSSTRWRSKSIA